ADLENAFLMGVANDRRDQSVLHRDGEGDVRGGEVTDLALAGRSGFPRGVDLRDAAEGFGAGFQDEVVDGEFDAFFFEAAVELFAQGEERSGVDFDFDVEMRILRLRFDETTRDRAAHVRDGNGALFLDGAGARGCAAGERAAG